MRPFIIICSLLISCFFGCHSPAKLNKQYVQIDKQNMQDKEIAILAAGCFWCVEAPFQLLEGVDTVVSGYLGGHIANPTYAQVCGGDTGHAEAVMITYNPEVISFDELLEVFFQLHDPTQLNRQGNDIGTQYRSAIFPVDAVQEQKARYYIDELNKEKAFNNSIVTTIEFTDVFYPAEDYHQNYYNLNSGEMYCQLVAMPKVEKIKKIFADKLKKKTTDK